MQEQPFISHIVELINRLRKALYAILISFILVFAFKYSVIKIDPPGILIIVPIPSIDDSFSVSVISFFIHATVPKGVEIITISPFDPLLAAAQTSLFLAIIIALPIVLWEVWAFVSPGLYSHEKHMLKVSVLPAMVLFTLGALFAYTIIIPVIFKFFLFYAKALNVEPTISLRSFVQTIFALMFSMGLAFQTPLIMTILTRFRIVKASTWRQYWRWGVLISFIFALIISPGATGGVIETTIGLTMSALYIVGMLASMIIERRQHHTEGGS
ncbi:twin-arginine translocase subunit TatC [Caldivirga sp. UBA161]|uniref:twin-arginine translocase subunit TatC n=1 Tax=Caldivirga sp. UBA161 TaxID=1915569 RepID=UPI0025C28B1B|nr:twin-arginine translocase subunit TatC [Caldivirga sp. UBA161]